MKILIADDDPVSRTLLQGTLPRWGLSVTAVADGQAAWDQLRAADAPPLAILDWLMPELDGVEICRKLRQLKKPRPTYVILLTSCNEPEDRVEGLDSGADDFIGKPFGPEELRARLQAGQRIVSLQQELSDRVSELETALARVKQLQGLLPICAYCKSIRNDQNYWQRVEEYVATRTDARFSHGICPRCYDTVVKPEIDTYRAAHCTHAMLTPS